MNYQWEEIFNTIESHANKNLIIIELLNFCKQKIAVNNKLKSVFRGNFFIEDLSKFKNLTTEMLETLFSHLAWTIESINSKLLFTKNHTPVIDFAKEIYCD